MVLNSLVARWEYMRASFQHSVENGDDRTKDWLLVYSPWNVLYLCVGYLVMCYVGPRLMANRKPFELRGVLVLYNFFMVVLSLYMFVELFLSSRVLNYSYLCEPLQYKTDSWSMRVAAAIWLYYFSKLIEFLDTLFFILRKKTSQITFLHVYHHVTMFAIWWTAAKWFAGGSSFFAPMINTFVHTIMYSYYMLSAFGERFRKYLWWKKYLTVLQLVQFVIVIVLNTRALITNCNFDKRVELSCAIYLTTLFLLFSNFFMKSYLKGGKRTSARSNLTTPVESIEAQEKKKDI